MPSPPAAATPPRAVASSSSSSSSQPSSSNASKAAIPDPQTKLSDYLFTLQSALQPLTQSAALLPNSGDLAFHKSIDRKLAGKLDVEADRLLASLSHLAGWIADHPQAPRPPAQDRNAKSKGKLQLDPDDVSAEGFPRSLGDLVDHLLEEADTCLDEYTGKIAPRKSKHANQVSNQKFAIGALPKNGPLPAKILNAPIAPPQRTFTHKPDNRSGVPWSRPLKLGKPHAKVPLGWKPPADQDGAKEDGDKSDRAKGVRRGMYCGEGDPVDNPYHYEIMHTTPPEWCYQMPDPVAPHDLDPDAPGASTEQTPFVWVDTAEKLQTLLDHLKEERVKEIAIDLEHHNYRTYQGIVCLMQLSTRWGDWIVDTISNEIREHSESLNAAFADPKKVKVLHGANHDVLWLQRDLGLYLVNLFDTYHATNILNFSGHGLNYLMQRYCNFDADKRYQLADWRIRPLPKEMLYYARSDTHSLLYIYDSLRKEMLESAGPHAIREVFELSKGVATAVYAKEDWDEDGEGRDGWRALWRKWGREAAHGSEARRRPEEMHKEERLVRRLHQWRDQVAREEDESPHYVLRAASLMMLASRAPVTVPGVVASFSPAVPALRKRAPELAQVIKDEVEAWEKDVRRKEKRIAEGLESGAVATGEEEDQEGDLGVAVDRSSGAGGGKTESVAPPAATAVAGLKAPVSAISAAAAADTTGGVNASLWSLGNDSDDAPSTIAPACLTSSDATGAGTGRSLTTALFGGGCSTTLPTSSGGNDAHLSARTSSLFGSATKPRPKPLVAPNAGGPSLFSLAQPHSAPAAPASSAPNDAQTRLVHSIRAQFAHDVAPVLRGGGGVGAPLPSVGGGDDVVQEGNGLAPPETVPFVPRDRRTAGGIDVPLSASTAAKWERADETGPTSASSPAHTVGTGSDADADGDEPDRIVDVKAGGKKKAKWSKERKRKRQEEAASGSSAPGAVVDSNDDGEKPTLVGKRQKGTATARVRSEAEFDFSNAGEVLGSSLAEGGGKARGKGKGGGRGDREGREEEERTARQPKKKNEIRGAAKSGTFAR